MDTTSATAFLNIDLAAQGNAAPEWVQLLPRGPILNARDGRSWTYDPQTVVAAFAANNGPLPIDYEHGQDILSTRGQSAPAAGWVVEMDNRVDGLWGKVEWTVKAAQMIADREYRFLSPSIRHDKFSEITRLAGAGLVNRPALEMTALSREQETSQQEKAMSLKAIAKALGLKDDADETAILAELTKRDGQYTAIASALDLEGETGLDAIAEQAKTVSNNLSTATASLKEAGNTNEVQALRTQLGETTAKLDDATTSLAALQEKSLNIEIEAALDEQVAAGKVTPASREQFRAMCAEEGGLERFTALAATLPVICAPSTLDTKDPTTTDPTAGDAVALAARANTYKTEQSQLGRDISTAQAIAELKDKSK